MMPSVPALGALSSYGSERLGLLETRLLNTPLLNTPKARRSSRDVLVARSSGSATGRPPAYTEKDTFTPMASTARRGFEADARRRRERRPSRARRRLVQRRRSRAHLRCL